MWTISSNDVQQAKERIDRRRAEAETRYTVEKNALAAELAAIEALERVATEFAQRHGSDGPATPEVTNIEKPSYAAAAESEQAGYPETAGYGASTEPRVEPEPAGYAEDAGYGGPTEAQVDTETASATAAETDPTGNSESNLAFDILKPGSRWRLNRAARLLNPEGAPVTPPPNYPSSSS